MTMKKALFLFVSLLLCTGVFAGEVWTVRTVPNTRLQGDEIHVSDPDNILADSSVQMINTSLQAIRDQVDVFVVALNSVGDADIDMFANELFNSWGIGEAGKDNGVLILLAKEQRQLRFETGYGAESILTDAKCQQIFENTIVPYFKEDEYGAGLCAGVAQVLSIYGGVIPDGLITQLPVHYESKDDENISFSLILIILIFGGLMLIIPIIAMGFYFAVDLKAKRVSSIANSSTIIDGVRYIDENESKWDGNPWGGMGCLKASMYGLSIFLFVFIGFFFEAWRVGGGNEIVYGLAFLYGFVLYLTWICMRQNGRALRAADKLARTSIHPREIYQIAYREGVSRITRWAAFWIGWIYGAAFKSRINRSGETQCPDCGGSMNHNSKFRYSPVQQKELELKSVAYKPYICGLGHVTVLKEIKDAKYQQCPQCHGITEHVIKSEVVTPATQSQAGLQKNTCRCECCGNVRVEEKAIPRIVQAMHGGSGGSHSSGSHSSSHRSYHSSSSHRGSFGGGRSGGGGYRGSW